MLQLEFCITDMRAWMFTNRLKLNGDKTKFLQFTLNSQSTKKLSSSQTLHHFEYTSQKPWGHLMKYRITDTNEKLPFLKR